MQPTLGHGGSVRLALGARGVGAVRRPRCKLPMSAGSTASRATLAGLAAIVLWSLLALLTTQTTGLPPLQVLALGFAIGGLAGLLFLGWRDRGLRALRQPPAAFALATAGLFGYHALYFFALKHAPPVEANLINYLWPLLLVVFAAAVPGGRASGWQWLGTLLGLAGAALVVTGGEPLALDPAHRTGYLAALAAAVTWAAYSVRSRRHAGVDPAAIAGPCLAVALLGGLAHGLFETPVAPDARQWAVLLAMGLGPVGLAFALWDRGCKHGHLPVLGTLAYLAPLLSTAWLLLAGVARPQWLQALACALIVGGGLLGLAGHPRNRRGDDPAAPGIG